MGAGPPAPIRSVGGTATAEGVLRMFGYIVRRIISGVLVLLVISVAVFALFFYGPSDPALAYCPETRCTPQRLENIRTSLGLDRPVLEQYGDYMKGIVAGNDFKAGEISIKCDAPCLGVSFKLRVNVTDYLLGKFPATLSIALGGSVIMLLIGISSGIFAARRRGTMADKGIVGVSLIVNAIPYYLLALLAAIVPVVTIFGLEFAYLLAGTIFTERIFDIQGIGLTGLQAIGTKDLPIIAATVLIGSAFIVVANIVVDIIYSVIDPRVRLS